MKAAVFEKKETLNICEIADPKPGPNEVVVRVTGCGVCGTDVHILHCDLLEGVSPPVVMEVGNVVELPAIDFTNLVMGQDDDASERERIADDSHYDSSFISPASPPQSCQRQLELLWQQHLPCR